MGTIDAFQRLVWSPQFKQNCFPHRSKMGVLKSFPDLELILRLLQTVNSPKAAQFYEAVTELHLPC